MLERLYATMTYKSDSRPCFARSGEFDRRRDPIHDYSPRYFRLSLAARRQTRLSPLTIVTGANGSGKSSLYRALRLLADVAQGRIVQSLAAEGGLQSTLWAGPESFSREMKAGAYPVQGLARKSPIALKLGFSGPLYGFAIELGLPLPSSSAFSLDPEIKIESLWTGELLGRAIVFAVRAVPAFA